MSNNGYLTQRSGKHIVRGQQRSGIRKNEDTIEQYEKPRFMIDIVGLVGVSTLTASDNAIYEYMLVHARENGISKKSHQVDLRQLMDFASIKDPQRVRQSLERIIRVYVKYWIVDPETEAHAYKPLLENLVFSTKKLSKKTTVMFSIPGIVRDKILSSRDYTWLDLDAFSNFRSKYTGRLYPKLALIAGYDKSGRAPWCPTVNEFAKFVGYTELDAVDDEVHYGSWDRVVDGMLNDIEEHVDDFVVTCVKPQTAKKKKLQQKTDVKKIMKGERARWRNPPSYCYRLIVSDRRAKLYASAAAKLSEQQKAVIENRADSPIEFEEHPNMLWLAQAQKLTGIDAIDLSNKWRMNLAAARLNPSRKFGILTGEALARMLDDRGVKYAFEKWILLSVMSADAAETMIASADIVHTPGAFAQSWVQEEAWYDPEKHETQSDDDLSLPADHNLDSRFVVDEPNFSDDDIDFEALSELEDLI